MEKKKETQNLFSIIGMILLSSSIIFRPLDYCKYHKRTKCIMDVSLLAAQYFPL